MTKGRKATNEIATELRSNQEHCTGSMKCLICKQVLTADGI